jgi:cytochrome b
VNTSTQTVKVWDPIVRIGHWTLVIAFFTAYFTEDDFMTQHIWAGYVLASIVVFRIIWGLIGSKHARFSDFVYKPSAIFGYLKGLAQRKPQHYLGHNPAGGAMVIALLFSLCVTVYSGFALYAVENNAGPFADIYGASAHRNQVDSHVKFAIISKALADEDMGQKVNEQDEEFWEGLHEFFANFTLLLVALHVAGVILSSKIDKENLIKAMFTGRKDIH